LRIAPSLHLVAILHTQSEVEHLLFETAVDPVPVD
jgi:hypothetical protein